MVYAESINKFYFEKQLSNNVSIDEMFVVIHAIKQTFNFKIQSLSSDVSKKIIIIFENEVKITIRDICNKEYLIVETNSKVDFDNLWDFFSNINIGK